MELQATNVTFHCSSLNVLIPNIQKFAFLVELIVSDPEVRRAFMHNYFRNYFPYLERGPIYL